MIPSIYGFLRNLFLALQGLPQATHQGPRTHVRVMPTRGLSAETVLVRGVLVALMTNAMRTCLTPAPSENSPAN